MWGERFGGCCFGFVGIRVRAGLVIGGVFIIVLFVRFDLRFVLYLFF